MRVFASAGVVRRVALVACLTVAVGGLGGCALMTPPLSEAEPQQVDQVVDDSLLVSPGTLTVALDTNDAPQAMVTADGAEGYEVDVARALAQELGLNLSLVSSVSPEDALGEGEADVFIGATTDDASDSIAVLGSCLENATAIFGGAGTVSPVSAESLAAATIGVQDSSASQEALSRAGIVSKQETFSNVNECFEALAAGTVDYVACDATAGAYLARAYPGVTFAGTLSAVSAQGIAASSVSSDLMDAVSDAFDDISSNGTLDAIHATWYGSLPFSLSDQLVAGVTVSATEDEPADDAPTGDLNSIGD